MHRMRLVPLAAAVTAVVSLAGCAAGSGTTSTGAPSGSASSSAAFPVTIENAFGSTTIESKPTRVATVGWANQEVPLALGVVPVGMPEVTWGDDDGDGVLPWVEDRLTALGAKTPVLFDEADGIDFEAVADTKPDVILAAYSGLTKADYDTLSKIAPVVGYPDVAWNTSLHDTIRLDSEAIGLGAEGDALIERLDGEIAAAAAAQPSIAGATGLFAYVDPTDVSKIAFYTTGDPRAGFLKDLGMAVPKVVADTEGTATATTFYAEVSAEEAQKFDDVDVMVMYGDDTTLALLQKDPLLSKIPAIAKGAVVILENSTPLAASGNPTPLSIGWGVGEYVDMIGAAAVKSA